MQEFFNKSILNFILVILLCGMVILSRIAYATNLFDSKRGVVAQEKTDKPAAVIKPKPKVTNVTYKLTAISKLANKYNLTFENVRKRDKVHTRWSKADPSAESLIKGYYIYEVVNRRVLFKAINEKKFRCHESKKEHVSCDPKNKIIAYELVTNKPVKTASIRPNKIQKQNNKNSANKKQKNQAQNTKQPFQPKRIEKQDVPDDMRLIKTPFGDRLVPK